MIDWTSFEVVFRSKPDYSLDSKQIDAIGKHRKELGGILFFDRIWTSIGLKQPQKAYPPKSNADLRSLWQKIAKAEVSDEKKQAVLFYVLRECRQHSAIDSVFVQKVSLPSKYQILVAGLWELDHLQYSRALQDLTDPSLTPEFADEILLTLLTAPKCDRTLALAYNLTVRPPLSNEKTLNAYFQLLVETNVLEAYRFCNGRDEDTHKVLFEELLRSLHEDRESSSGTQKLVTLLSIPFTDDEASWFKEYLQRGPGSKMLGAKDTVLMHRFVTGDLATQSGTVEKYRGQTFNGMNWDDIRSTLKIVPQ